MSRSVAVMARARAGAKARALNGGRTVVVVFLLGGGGEWGYPLISPWIPYPPPPELIGY